MNATTMRLALAMAACTLIAACGSSSGSAADSSSTPTAGAGAIPSPTARVATAPLLDWPEFGFGPVFSPPSGALVIAPSHERNDQSIPIFWSYSKSPWRQISWNTPARSHS